ncbi:hypothetical protein [Polymorphospora rubra]|uniref:hypothetical protein n=1 Tax=Polymorphospora rubra TaxID=338584 RepID=UPI001BB37AFA|nr:hypothetical protein [Polymorphospora rubra]
MDEDALRAVAALLGERNAIDAKIAGHIGRPMTAGHLGEWIAAQIFDIDLEPAANARAFDGRFASGPLAGQTVNVKWYLQRDGILDVARSGQPDHYLVLTGPVAPAGTSRGGVRPWWVESVHLFDAGRLVAELESRGSASAPPPASSPPSGRRPRSSPGRSTRRSPSILDRLPCSDSSRRRRSTPIVGTDLRLLL